jgi:hypothetical protein
MQPRVYLETTIISYLVALSSRDLIIAAHQQVTQEWWASRRAEFDLCVSPLVIQEASAGDKDAAARRLGILTSIPILETTDQVSGLAQAIVASGAMPPKAIADALHVAYAAVHQIEYLLTWNLAHLANAAMRSTIEEACRSKGYEPPIICTPEELLEA